MLQKWELSQSKTIKANKRREGEREWEKKRINRTRPRPLMKSKCTERHPKWNGKKNCYGIAFWSSECMRDACSSSSEVFCYLHSNRGFLLYWKIWQRLWKWILFFFLFFFGSHCRLSSALTLMVDSCGVSFFFVSIYHGRHKMKWKKKSPKKYVCIGVLFKLILFHFGSVTRSAAKRVGVS